MVGKAAQKTDFIILYFGEIYSDKENIKMSNETMKACVLHAVGDFRYEDVPMPKRGEGEVLLKIHVLP